MHVEGAEPGHRPYHFGQHPECHHHLKVCFIAAEPLDKRLVFHLFGLQYVGFADAAFQCEPLHIGHLQRVVMPSHRLVGLSNHGNNVVSAVQKCLQRAYGKLWRSHENDSQIFFLHIL